MCIVLASRASGDTKKRTPAEQQLVPDSALRTENRHQRHPSLAENHRNRLDYTEKRIHPNVGGFDKGQTAAASMLDVIGMFPLAVKQKIDSAAIRSVRCHAQFRALLLQEAV